jgi:hypothetical protein
MVHGAFAEVPQLKWSMVLSLKFRSYKPLKRQFKMVHGAFALQTVG